MSFIVAQCRQRITNPLIYTTVSGHEAIVSMVAPGCGVALIPSVVVDNSPEPVRNRISLLDDISLVEPFELGVCVQKKRLSEPLIEAFLGAVIVLLHLNPTNAIK
ncbi:LysR family transcriptional regulator [Yersinia enterocolitica]|nr:LysR family transcriptional regulator [Yersinia enterocolitica]